MESPDVVRPTFRNGSVNLSTGFFQLTFSETIKTIPTTQVAVGFIGVLNESGAGEGISFVNAAIIGENSREKTLKFTILESRGPWPSEYRIPRW